MKKFVGEVFRALLELLGPISSMLLGVWLIAAFWYGYDIDLTLPIPFTTISMDHQGVRDLLVMGYMVIQTLLVVDLYTSKYRGGQTSGRNAVEFLFSLFPLVVLIVVLWQKQTQTGGFDELVWGQSDSHLMVLGFFASVVDILLTIITWQKPAPVPK